MKTIIISVGNEVTSGHTVNTNAAWIAKTLDPYGVTPERVVTMRDDEKALVKEIRSAVKQYELILITGGLGPTPDDVTKPALVKAFRTRLVRDKKTLAAVKRFFKKLNIPMPPINVGQADYPECFTLLQNKWGTASGLYIEKDSCMLFALPGVPYEMKNLIEKNVVPLIKKRFPSKTIVRTVLHTIGVGESTLLAMIDDASCVDDGIELAYLPHFGQVDLRLTVKGETAPKAKAVLNKAAKKLIKVSGQFYYGRDDDTLEGVIGAKFAKKGLTLASAESCTGGLFASKITSVTGASQYFLQGLVTYSNESKVKRLGVRESTLEKFGSVSAATAAEMAKGVCETSGADIGVSSTGVAGPTGGTKEKPVGLVYIGLCVNGDVKTKVFQFGGKRVFNQERTVQAMLTWLLREVSEI